ncbi:acid phosphatase/acid phosphatase (class A) [Verrucomicrobium sp. GAS474]|uniref:phosphatase PAP2 family protein n=1 Tax=Verrucomicrobium sp. GAS474 TaxID=1882831 RepID=UPI00087B17C4|nr:phosphatase PAP2 family protein [Verrucomicrobium sp. GAS474]SDU16509.1 acid phosphatase/acid phosphatase (class A) [Verrucomicrobium sp. GAS474]
MRLLLLSLLFLLPLAPLPAKESKPVYLDPATVDIAILGNPPADGSAETRAEIETLLAFQQSRTPAEVARATAEIDYDPAAFFSGVLDPAWFNAKTLPLTFALLEAVKADSKNVTAQGKSLWKRPRPPLQDSRLHPACPLPDSASYPSSHAALGITWARILSEALPDLKNTLLERGTLAGKDRNLLGVHFPSDVAAGQKLGLVLADRFLALPAFQADLAKVKTEIEAARPQPIR